MTGPSGDNVSLSLLLSRQLRSQPREEVEPILGWGMPEPAGLGGDDVDLGEGWFDCEDKSTNPGC